MNFPEPDMDEVSRLRVPPHSLEAEHSVLAGLLLDNSAYDRCGDILNDKDFYKHEHRLIYEVIAGLVNSNKPADVVTVFERLQSVGKAADVGGLKYLNSVAQSVPSAANIRRYAEIVRERSLLRKLVAASDEIATAAFNPNGKSAVEILDMAQESVMQVAEQGPQTTESWEGADKLAVKFIDNLNDVYEGKEQDLIETGLRDLDDRLGGGMRPGELIVIGARPSMGKSALAMGIGLHVGLVCGLPVGELSMEMPKPQLSNRKIANLSSVPLHKIKNPVRLNDYEWGKISEATEKLAKSLIYVHDRPGLTINSVRSLARDLKRKHGLKLLIIDYLGLMVGPDPKQSRVYQLEDITKGLKALANELGIAVILLAQVKRGVEERSDQMPMMSDLRDSGSIEQDADVVMFVHREHKVKPDLGDEWKYYAKVSVAKLRDGEPGSLHLQFVGENVCFRNWPIDTPIPTSKVRGTSGGL